MRRDTPVMAVCWVGTALDNWVNLTLVQTRTFPDGVVLTRYETRR